MWSIEEILSLCKYGYTSRSESRGLAGNNDVGVVACTDCRDVSLLLGNLYSLNSGIKPDSGKKMVEN